MGSGDSARAAFVGAICSDAAFTGGKDFFVTDNGAGDNIVLFGGINFTVSAFGYILAMGSQSKPIIGSSTAPQLGLTYSATSVAGGGGTMRLRPILPHQSSPFHLTLGGANSGGSCMVTGTAFGGTSNTVLDVASQPGETKNLAQPDFRDAVFGMHADSSA